MNSRYCVKYKRRRDGKTNYTKRIKLLSSKKNLVVFRKLSRILLAQIVKFDAKGDSVLASVSSKELEKYGWKFSKKNLPAAYLTGYLLAKKAKEQGELIVNFGIINPTKGASNYAFLKGALDGGLKIAHSTDLFPDDARIKGTHIEKLAAAGHDKLQFSKTPDAKSISKIFEDVKKKIASV
jgi:large subunit ribosomal protein L18